MVAARSASFVVPRHPGFSPKTAPLVVSKQALSARQKAAVFALLKHGLFRGATILEGMKAVAQAKRDFGLAIKAQLSRRRQTRFDRTYGKDARGLFAFLTAATMGK